MAVRGESLNPGIMYFYCVLTGIRWRTRGREKSRYIYFLYDSETFGTVCPCAGVTIPTVKKAVNIIHKKHL